MNKRLDLINNKQFKMKKKIYKIKTIRLKLFYHSQYNKITPQIKFNKFKNFLKETCNLFIRNQLIIKLIKVWHAWINIKLDWILAIVIKWKKFTILTSKRIFSKRKEK